MSSNANWLFDVHLDVCGRLLSVFEVKISHTSHESLTSGEQDMWPKASRGPGAKHVKRF